MSILTIDELEMLNPTELGELVHHEVFKNTPDFQYIQDIYYVGCPIDAWDRGCLSALHRAATNGHLEMVEFLLSKGVEVNARDKDGWTPLHWGARNGHLGVVEFLISKGAQVDARTNVNGWTALHIASKLKNLDIVKYLVSVGADIHARTAGGWIARDTTTEKSVPELEPK